MEAPIASRAVTRICDVLKPGEFGDLDTSCVNRSSMVPRRGSPPRGLYDPGPTLEPVDDFSASPTRASARLRNAESPPRVRRADCGRFDS